MRTTREHTQTLTDSTHAPIGGERERKWMNLTGHRPFQETMINYTSHRNRRMNTHTCTQVSVVNKYIYTYMYTYNK